MREGEKTQLKDAAGNFIDDVRYYHVRVSNERRRWITAEDVQVYLTRVDEPWPDGLPQPTWNGNIPVRWRDQEIVPLTRTIGSAADIDLFRVERQHGLFLMPLLIPHNLNAHRQGPCRLALHVQVRSKQADSRIHHISIAWDGQWEDGDTEMARHVRVGEPTEVRDPEPLPEY